MSWSVPLSFPKNVKTSICDISTHFKVSTFSIFFDKTSPSKKFSQWRKSIEELKLSLQVWKYTSYLRRRILFGRKLRDRETEREINISWWVKRCRSTENILYTETRFKRCSIYDRSRKGSNKENELRAFSWRR